MRDVNVLRAGAMCTTAPGRAQFITNYKSTAEARIRCVEFVVDKVSIFFSVYECVLQLSSSTNVLYTSPTSRCAIRLFSGHLR
jgi:hypothetical protein